MSKSNNPSWNEKNGEKEITEEEYYKNVVQFQEEFRRRQQAHLSIDQGKCSSIYTNFLKVDIDPTLTFFIHPVEFDDRYIKTYVKAQAIEKLNLIFHTLKINCIVTSSILVSPNRLKPDDLQPQDIQVTDFGRKKSVRVRFGEEMKVRFDDSEDSDYQECEQVLNTILHHVFSTSEKFQKFYTAKQTRHAKHYWSKHPIMESMSPKNIRRLSDTFANKRIFQTMNCSFTSRESGWHLVIFPKFRNDIKPFSALKSMKYIAEMKQPRHGKKNEEDPKKLVAGEIEKRYYVKFLLYDNERRTTKKISFVDYSLNPFSPTKHDPSKSYVDYYMQRYPNDLKRLGITKPEDIDPDQPLFRCDPESQFTMSGHKALSTPLFYIPQLVGIAGQENLFKYKMEWASRNQRETLEAKITKVREFVRFLGDCDIGKKLEEYNIHVDLTRDLEKCDTVTLPTLTLHNHFADQIHFLGDGSKWEKNVRHIKLKDTIEGTQKRITMDNIVCIYCEGYENEKMHCLKTLNEIAYKKWIKFPWGDDITSYCLVYGEEEEEEEGFVDKERRMWNGGIIPLLHEIVKEKKPDIIIMIPDGRRDLYDDFISFTMENGIVEQVVRGDTIRYKQKMRGQIMYNIFLQVYCKLGGFLWNVGSFLKPFIEPKRTNTMLIGIDASRETNRSYVKLMKNNVTQRIRFPSSYAVVAVVLEKEWTCRQGYLLKKEKAQEISRAAAIDSLRFFIEKFRSTFPNEELDRIVVFRDGVANTQVEKLRDREISGILEVLKEISPKTEFSFLLIQKNVKAFFCGSGGIGHSGGSGNPTAGSVVSSGITFSKMQIRSFYLNTDFYLVSSTGSGEYSSKPCHYLLLHNSAEGSEEDLQKLTFASCNLYFNFRGTIKTPFVAQLAHKLADKIYKSVFFMKRVKDERFKGVKRLCVKTKIFCLNSGTVMDGTDFEDTKGNVRICVHDNFHDKFFEL